MKRRILTTLLLIIYIFAFIIAPTVFANGSGGNGLFTVPEPATLLLLGVGMVGLAGFGRKKFKK